MNICPNPYVIKTERVRATTARVPRRRNPDADDYADAAQYPILSLHWPNFPALVIEAERAAA